MAKFCGKCGARLDEKTGLCPNCDVEQIKNNTILPQKGQNPQPVSAPNNRKKKPKKSGQLLKILLCLAVILLLCIGVLGLADYLGWLELPFYGTETGDVSWEGTPDTDLGEIVHYPSSEEHVVQDADTGILYFDNEILVAINSEEDRPQLEAFLADKGTIVGEIPMVAQYQILLDTSMGYQEIETLAAELETMDWVVYASPNYALEQPDISYIPNDEEWKDEWETAPGGSNWGLEAIDAPGAWEYLDQMQAVNVGVFDDMFFINEDLHFDEIPLANRQMVETLTNQNISPSNHGTHVAGTIAADFNNKNGIAGTVPKCNLYGASYKGLETKEDGYFGSQAINVGFAYLIAVKQCAVVNMSWGYDLVTFNASRNDAAAILGLEQTSDAIADFLQLLLDNGYEFVICKAAGNQNEEDTANRRYQYFEKDPDDQANITTYLNYQEYLDYLDGKGGETAKQKFSRYQNRKKEIRERLVSGNVDAKYDILGTIDNPEVANRIIMVGSIQPGETHKEGGFLGFGGEEVYDGYEIAPYSQCGERVDILAPGGDSTIKEHQIYSTVRTGYDYKAGTSMASPHAAGVAALVFSVNPDLTGEDVKRILKESAVGSYGEEGYGLLNAKNAVEMALNTSPIPEQSNITQMTDQEDAFTQTLSPTEAYVNAVEKLQGASFHVRKAGTMYTQFSSVAQLNFTEELDIQDFELDSMTGNGSYWGEYWRELESGLWEGNFVYDKNGFQISDQSSSSGLFGYNYMSRNPLLSLELPPEECLIEASISESDDGSIWCEFTFNGDSLTEENCGIFANAPAGVFSIYWDPNYPHEDGIQQASLIAQLDHERNLKTIDISYELIGGVQGTSPMEGKTTFFIESIASDSRLMENDAGVLDYDTAKQIVLDYYNQMKEDDGTYVIFDDETVEMEDRYLITVRYQLSEQEATQRLQEGRIVEANTLVGIVTFEKETGQIYNSESGVVIESSEFVEQDREQSEIIELSPVIDGSLYEIAEFIGVEPEWSRIIGCEVIDFNGLNVSTLDSEDTPFLSNNNPHFSIYGVVPEMKLDQAVQTLISAGCRVTEETPYETYFTDGKVQMSLIHDGAGAVIRIVKLNGFV